MHTGRCPTAPSRFLFNVYGLSVSAGLQPDATTHDNKNDAQHHSMCTDVPSARINGNHIKELIINMLTVKQQIGAEDSSIQSASAFYLSSSLNP